MRISRGKYRSREIKTLDTLTTRPTASKTKEAIFNMISFQVENALVLDLFAGSGLLGIEALSMYAKHVDFNDSNIKATKLISENLKMLNETNYSLSNQDALTFLKTSNQQYDIIFLDPPYDLEMINELVSLIIDLKLIKEDGTIIAESSVEEQIFNGYQSFNKIKDKKYGKNKISIFRSR